VFKIEAFSKFGEELLIFGKVVLIIVDKWLMVGA
jgi:hypothetical protein